MYFLGGLGAVRGPLFGVIMADYWLIRRARVNVPDLYTESSDGEYHFTRGFDLRAVTALVPSAAIAVVIAIVPLFHAVAGFSWFIGAALGLGSSLLLADRCRPATEVSGEPLAVPSVH